MTSFADAIRVTRVAAVIAALAAVAGLHAQGQEDSARRRLESGRAFLQSQNYGEALKDFQVILQTMRCSKSRRTTWTWRRTSATPMRTRTRC